jgi:hypothetical protein
MVWKHDAFTLLAVIPHEVLKLMLSLRLIVPAAIVRVFTVVVEVWFVPLEALSTAIFDTGGSTHDVR